MLGWLGGGTQLADLFLQVRINGDVALLKGIMKEVLAADERSNGNVLDWNFIEPAQLVSINLPKRLEILVGMTSSTGVAFEIPNRTSRPNFYRFRAGP